jgi:hypothetical protein
MADFSKQWCEANDPEMKPDFDIHEIAENLENGYYTSIICEGFGFIAIGKDNDGATLLAVPTDDFPDQDGNSKVEWKKYEEIIK